ncbi:MAG: Rrf2 family transcriptional regulator [Butyrivibrio sp.]|uniref:Rrf2 family transcriptional regulator n=1 Tax=Butyrivibrio sp. TaxID=28121 RepID=UPI001B1E89C3|nr:Rrf2 family transcriptional regulator [Butyrivibrio sp.]MBO5622274.1 Rrf2 family transcriptional regulator [Butyrivibrio sp.]MBP3784760.1 Rrf2 family transcriptional regulator [Butyrivibrio sp.]MBQ6406812.1 Rrf2 family transcriptional regulator [Butyrivibrio sp.]
MQFSSKLAVSTHILLAIIEFDGKAKTTSTFLAGSVNANPVIVRNMLLMLQEAGFIKTKPGVGGSEMAMDPKDITLKDVLLAVEKDTEFFKFHENPNPNCPVGRNVHQLLDDKLADAKNAMLESLSKTTLADLAKDMKILIKEQEAG